MARACPCPVGSCLQAPYGATSRSWGARWARTAGVAIIHHTKNGERRALAITGLAAHVLDEWSKTRQTDGDQVFPGRRGGASFPQLAWKLALADAGIEDFRFHDLRHAFASYLAMSGATLAELAEAMGHKTLQMVKRYAHPTEGHTAGVVARMTERFMAA